MNKQVILVPNNNEDWDEANVWDGVVFGCDFNPGNVFQNKKLNLIYALIPQLNQLDQQANAFPNN